MNPMTGNTSHRSEETGTLLMTSAFRINNINSSSEGTGAAAADEALREGPTFDLARVVQVSHALSSEIKIDRLLDTLMRLAIEHAGAQRGFLLLPNEDDWQIVANAETIGEVVSVALSSGISGLEDIPESILNYVVRTRSTVLLEDASTQNDFAFEWSERNEERQSIRSVLCLPLLLQSRIVGLLYLENNFAPGVFTQHRSEVLGMLATQAAISLENARLYSEVERENAEHRAAESESARVNAALNSSESRFRGFADTTPDVIWITELNPERVVYASPSFERIWGHKVEDLYREPHLWIDGIHADDRQRVMSSFIEWIGGNSAVQWESEFRVVNHQTNAVRWIHDRGVIRAQDSATLTASGIATDITERRVAEEALRKSEGRLTLAMAGVNDGIWDWDIGEECLFLSERAQSLCGLEPARPTRKRDEWLSIVDIHQSDTRNFLRRTRQYLGNRCATFDVELRVGRRDGNYRWVRLRGVCIRNSLGSAMRFVGSVTDVDAHKRAEQQLKRSEEAYSLAMKAARDGHWDWIIETNEYYMSPRLLEIYGISSEAQFATREEFISKFPFYPEDAQLWRNAIADHFSGNTAEFQIEFRVLRQGQLRWVHMGGLLSRDSSGRPIRWTGSVSDITESKASELALRESEERFALATVGSNDGIWDWDLLTNQMFMSNRAQQLYGLEPGPKLRLRHEWVALVVLHSDDLAAQRQMVSGYLDGSLANYDGEWRILNPDGIYRWVHIRGVCLRDGNGQATRLAGSVSDVDTRRRAEAAVQQMQRLEAVGTLASGVAHDFNNILSAILGFSEASIRRTRPGGRIRRDLECILLAGERGRTLVERILTFSRSSVAERIAVDVENVVKESLAMIEAMRPTNVRMETRLSGTQLAMIGDPTQMSQVLINLATNAMQSMPNGGVLYIELHLEVVNEKRLTATALLAAGEYIVLSIRDTGVGIDAIILNRIFDPFFTTKEVGSGTGLGLSLVHGIVSEFGGAVSVESVVGMGSTFTVYLPRVNVEIAPPLTEISKPPRGAHEQILVVDDEDVLVRLVTDQLTESGYVPVGFTSSIEALAAFKARADRFDAVVTDERMPRLSGAKLIRALREIRPDIPILMVSGYLGADIVSRALEAGADAVLRKPLSTLGLATAIQQLLRSRTVGTKRAVEPSTTTDQAIKTHIKPLPTRTNQLRKVPPPGDS